MTGKAFAPEVKKIDSENGPRFVPAKHVPLSLHPEEYEKNRRHALEALKEGEAHVSTFINAALIPGVLQCLSPSVL
jgi:hypothetical protein